MATVTGLTAQRMLEIEAMSIVNGGIDLATGRLKLERHDGGIIDAGDVRGVGLTPGGDTGEAFFKKSANDFDTEWRNIDASDVRSGQFEQDRIPQLKAIDYKIDILYNDPNPITVLRSVPGTNNSGGTVVISPNEFGASFNNEWKVRFDSSGTMTHGLIPGHHLSGSAGVIDPHLVPGYNRDPNGGDSWWTTDREGNWDAGTRMVFHNYAVAHNWHFGFWNANGDEELLVGNDGQRYFRASSIYGRTTTAGANVVIGWWGDLSRSTSLRAAKAAIEDAPQNWAEKVWSLQPRTWIDKGDAERLADALSRETEGEEVDWSDTMVAPLRRIPGFVAEEVEEAGLEEFLVRDEAGELTGLAYDRFSALLLVAMKDEREKRIAAEARVEALEAAVQSLAEKIEALAARLPEEPAPADN